MRYPIASAVVLTLMFAVLARGNSPGDLKAATKAALGKTSAETRIENRPLPEALAIVAKAAGVEIEFDWKRLESVGVTKETPTAGRFRNVKFGKVLTLLLDAAAGSVSESSPPALAYIIKDDGKVVVTTANAIGGDGL